ncbi:MAG TPA: hypothetical protein VIX80_09175 [Candidatus Kapabacteria bacterium]
MTPETMLTFNKIYLTVIFLTVFGLMSCDNSTGSGPDPSSYFSISGTLKNPKSLAIPSNAKLYVVWMVSSGSPDYGYIVKAGSINSITNTFSLTLYTPPPAEALNRNELGIAYIILSTASIPEGKLLDDDILNDSTTMIGAISDRAIVYVNGSPDTANYNRAWVKDFNFKTGYNFGKGWYNPNPGFDGFMPDSSAIQLLISRDPDDFIFPNWT